jgi:hypothetical protein
MTKDPLQEVTSSTYRMKDQGTRRMHESMNQVRPMHPGMKHTPVDLATLRRRV